VDLAATLTANLQRQPGDRQSGLLPLPARPAWHLQRFEQRPRRLVLFVVDTSDSMGDAPENRMTTALGMAVSLLRYAYLQRDRVALITFRDRAASLTVPPTGSIPRVYACLRHVAVGGATPLADGLRMARETIRQERLKERDLNVLMVLVSDGEATVPLRRGGNPLTDCLEIAAELRKDQVASILIDTGSAASADRLLPRLATTLGGVCRRLQDVGSNDLLKLLATPPPGRNRT